MRELLEQIVADFDIRRIPIGTPREVSLPGISNKADAVIGMRRSGKTWLLFEEIRAALAQGVHPEDLLYFNFEDERLLPMQAENLQWIVEGFHLRRSGAGRPDGARIHLFFDEVQNVPQWEVWIRRLLDQENARILLTGSSAKLLSQEIATSLRGRSLATELMPFSFAEYLRHKKLKVPTTWPPMAETRRRLIQEFDSYLHVGGFPEVQGQTDQLRIRILQDYIDIVLLRDVAERHSVENLGALRYLQRSLLSRPSNRFSIHKIYNDLKSQGVRVGKDSLHEYLGYFEDVFLLFTTEIYSKSYRVRQVNPRKVYPIDSGLAAAMSFEVGSDVGHLLETVVYLELRRRGFEVSWLKTSSGYEVDFMARDLLGSRILMQVSADLSSPSTRERELRALEEAMAENQFDSSLVVTLRDLETVDVGGRTIRIVPAWRWLLEDREIGL